MIPVQADLISLYRILECPSQKMYGTVQHFHPGQVQNTMGSRMKIGKRLRTNEHLLDATMFSSLHDTADRQSTLEGSARCKV